MVFFDAGSAELSAFARDRFTGFVLRRGDVCSLNPDPRLRLAVVITGHADKSGPEERNDQLGLQRARNVAALLVEFGMSREHVCVRSMGSKAPIVRTDDPQPENRRVELSFGRMTDPPAMCTWGAEGTFGGAGR